MMCTCRFIRGTSFTPLVWNVDVGGRWKGRRGIWEKSVLSAQFCYESKTAPRISLRTAAAAAKVSNEKDPIEGLGENWTAYILAAVPLQALMPQERGSVSPEQSHCWRR